MLLIQGIIILNNNPLDQLLSTFPMIAYHASACTKLNSDSRLGCMSSQVQVFSWLKRLSLRGTSELLIFKFNISIGANGDVRI